MIARLVEVREAFQKVLRLASVLLGLLPVCFQSVGILRASKTLRALHGERLRRARDVFEDYSLPIHAMPLRALVLIGIASRRESEGLLFGPVPGEREA